MTKLEFEALKAKYPNRLRCFAMKGCPEFFIMFDLRNNTRTSAHEYWTLDRVDEHLSKSNCLPSMDDNHKLYTMHELIVADKWEEL